MLIKKLIHGFLLVLLLVSTPTWSAQTEAQPEAQDEKAGRMIGDLLFARPLGIVATGIGAAAFLVSLPFTILSDSVGDAADTLVTGPATSAFKRCLGCTTVD